MFPAPLALKKRQTEVPAFKKVMGLLFCIFALPLVLMATHFRFGLITATRISETATTVTYRLNVSTAFQGFTSTGIYSITGGNTGSVNIPMSFVTDPSGAWINGTGSAVVTLNKTTVPTRISWSSGNKISSLVNNRDRLWDVFLVLNTANPGSTPVTSLPAIINMPVNATAATYLIPASDPDPGSTLTFGTPSFTGNLAGQSNPAGFSVNTAGLITFNTIGKIVGQLYNAMVTVTDNHGNQIMMDFIIQMVGASNPAAFDYTVMPLNGSVFNVIAGQNISFPIKASDPDAGSSVNLSVSGLPAYITTANFSPAFPATGNPALTTFSWTPTAAQVGHTVVLNFIATDNVGVQSTTSVTLKIVAEPAPTFESPTPPEGDVRQILTGVLHQDVIMAQSSLGSPVSIAFATVPAGSLLSPAVPTTAANPGQTTFSWTPGPADWGEHQLSFQAVIAATPTIFATRTFKLIVNTPPAFTSTPATSVNAGESYSYQITVADADLPYGDQLSIISSALPSWLTLTDHGNGTATLSGTPSVADAGNHSIHLDAEDIHHGGNPSHVEQSFTLQVLACNTTVNTKAATLFLGPDGKATLDPAAINDGSTAECGIQSMAVVPAEFDCSNIGANAVTFTLVNNMGVSFTATQTVNVVDVTAPVISTNGDQNVANEAGLCAASVVVSASAADNCSVGQPIGSRSDGKDLSDAYPVGVTTITWTVTDANGNAAAAVLQTITVVDTELPVITTNGNKTVSNDAGLCAAVVWVSAVAADNCSVGQPSGARSDGKALTDAYPVGSTTITWTVTDVNGNAALSVVQTVTVTDNEQPVITTNSSQAVSNDAGLCGAVVAVSATAADNCAVGLPVGVRSDGKALTDVYPVGITTITWNVTDVHGNAATTVTQTVTVTNTVPVITLVQLPVGPVPINSSVTLNLSHDDNNLTSAHINWGDGTPVQLVSNPAQSFATPHNYSAPGVYRVTGVLTDACGSTVSFEYEYVVVYDATAGFVTGGGWIQSPAGAYRPDVTVQGKAHFGFESKYERGATVPSGRTEFRFQAGNMNFASTSYQWLVVSGSRAQYKGSGTINGAGNYGFILTTVDGNMGALQGPDLLRIKIWDKINGDAVVYDNQFGDEDDGAVTTALAGGSVVIHVPRANRSENVGPGAVAEQAATYGRLHAQVLSNPASTQFTLLTSSSRNTPIRVTVVDLVGRVVEASANLAANGSIAIGAGFRPGSYYAVVEQGTERVVLKLVKLH